MISWKALAARRRAALGVNCFGARLTTSFFELALSPSEVAVVVPGAEGGVR